MRILLDHLFTSSRPAILVLGACAFMIAAPAFAQDDILLPADEAAPLIEDGVPEEPLQDPSVLSAPVEPGAEAQAEDAMQNLLENINEGNKSGTEGAPAVPETAPQVVEGAPPADTGLTPEPDATAESDVSVVPALPADQTPR
jgi:hypothetical protein